MADRPISSLSELRGPDLALRTPGLGRASADQPTYGADVITEWQVARSRWRSLTERGTAFAFQQLPWLDAWYRQCLGSATPAIVFIKDRDGRDAFALPLVAKREGGLRVIAFADGGLTDYNAPVIAADVPLDHGPALLRALCRFLPPADLLCLEKMPVTLLGTRNPIAALPGIVPSKLAGFIVEVPGPFDVWYNGWSKQSRRRIERGSRVFDRHPQAAMHRYAPGVEAQRAYDRFKRLQSSRIAELGLPYILDQEPAQSFYDDIVRDGLRDGSAIFTALTIGDDVLAGMLGVADGRHYAVTRMTTTSDPRYKSFSPGSLLIQHTLKILHNEGYRAFDFTIGDYSYKRQLGATIVPMVEMVQALSPFGWPRALKHRTKATIKQHPALVTQLQRLRSKFRPSSIPQEQAADE